MKLLLGAGAAVTASYGAQAFAAQDQETAQETAQGAIQDAAEDAAARAQGDRSLDQIVVTAQKRAESASDIGVSLSVIGGEGIENQNIVNVADIAELIPNLEIAIPNGPGTQPAIYLRGVGVNDFNTNNNGPIAVYSDEVYRSSFVNQNLNLFDVERLEVLKGPQGTLFGRNATGGAIRVIANKPGDAFELDGSVRYGEFNTLRAEGAVNLPVSERIAVRAAVVHGASDGFVDDIGNGVDTGGYDFISWRGQVAVDATDTLSILLAAEGTHTDNPGAGFAFQGLLDPDTGAPCALADIQANRCANPLGDLRPEDRFDVDYDRLGSTVLDAYIASATIAWDLGFGQITSVSAYETVADFAKKEDTDVSPSDLLAVDFNVDSETFSQELRFDFDHDRARGTIGVFYLTEELNQDQTADIFRVFRPLVEAIDPVAFPGGFDPGGLALGAPVTTLNYLNTQDTETVAVFSQGEVDVTDTLRLIAGLRYTYETRDFETLGQAVEPGFSAPLFETVLSIDNENVTYKAGLEWDAMEDLLIYGHVSTGFKSGGFNGGFPLSAAEVAPFDEETLTAYEIGAKAAWPSQAVQLNAAAFYYDYTDIQVFTFVNAGALPVTVLTNAGDARIFGFEADAVWRATSDLTLTAALGLLDTEFERFEADATLGTGDFTGNTLPLAPEASAVFAVDYARPVSADLTFYAAGDVSYRSKVFFDPSNSPLLQQGGYALVDLSVGFGRSDGRWRADVFVENLFDEEFDAYAVDFSSFGFNQRTLGPPRAVGGRISFQY